MSVLAAMPTVRDDADLQASSPTLERSATVPPEDGRLNKGMDVVAADDGRDVVPVPHDNGADASGSKPTIVVDPGRASEPASANASDGHTTDVDHGESGHRPNLSLQAPHPSVTPDACAHKSRWSKDDNLPPLPTAAAPSPPTQSGPGLFKRITTKLRSHTSSQNEPANPPVISPPSAFLNTSSSQRARSRSRSRTRSSVPPDAPDAKQPRIPKRKPILRLPSMPVPVPSGTLPNSFTSPEHRHAALVARGLVPPSASSRRFRDENGYMMPLSEQEKELDRRFAVVVDKGRAEQAERDSEAKRIKEAWLARNRAHPDLDEAPTAASGPGREGEIVKATSAKRTVREDKRYPDLGEEKSTKRATVHEAHAAGRPDSSEGGHDYAAILEAITVSPSPEQLRNSVDFSALQAQLRPLPPIPPEPARRRSSDVTERVSRWLHTSIARRSKSSDRLGPRPSSAKSRDSAENSQRRSNDVYVRPRPYSQSDDGHTPLLPHTRTSQDRKAPPSSFNLKFKKEKPTPIVVTVSPSSRPGSSSSAVAIAASTTGHVSSVSQPDLLHSLDTGLTDSEQGHGTRSLGPRRVRGRSGDMSQKYSQSSQGLSTTPESGYSVDSQNRLPALSPTRTACSSSPSESVLPATPTTLSHGCDNQSKKQARNRSRRATGYGTELRIQTELGSAMDTSLPRAGEDSAHVVVDSPLQDDLSSSEEPSSSADGALNAKMASEAQKMKDLMAAAAATPRPRPRKASPDSERRRSLTRLFTRKSESDSEDAPPPFKNPRSSTSMQNLRRNITGTLTSLRVSRPKSSVDSSASIRASLASYKFPPATSPPSSFPSAPPSSFSRPPSSFPSALRKKPSREPSPGATPVKSTVGVGLRPRQALSPTMHDRGSILVEAGRIQDEESRRLSEMAFLDY